MNFFMFVAKGVISNYEIIFVGDNKYHPNEMEKYSSIEDCFSDYEQSVQYFDLDKKGREIIKIAEKTIKELRTSDSSFLILIGTVEDNKVIFSFDDNTNRRGKVSGPILHISSSFYPKTYINSFWRTFFKPTLQYERYYSTFFSPKELDVKVKFSIL